MQLNIDFNIPDNVNYGFFVYDIFQQISAFCAT